MRTSRPLRLREGLRGLFRRKAPSQMPQTFEMLGFLIGQVDPAGFPRTADRIRSQFQLYSYGTWNPFGTQDPKRRAADLFQLSNSPELAQVFLFHGDGFLREAALHRLSGPIRLPVVVYGLLERLNDWSPEVRSAAALAFDRCFPVSDPEILLGPVWICLQNGRRWSRWNGGYDRLIAAVLSHEPLNVLLLQRLLQDRRGGTGTIFQALCRHPRFDPYLVQIATGAKLPALRAKVVDSISRGKAFWPLGTSRKVWVDKPAGLYRLEPEFASRPLSLPLDALPVLTDAVRDPSIVVRRIALDGIIARRDDIRFRCLVESLQTTLHSDPRPSIVSRLAFLLIAPRKQD